MWSFIKICLISIIGINRLKKIIYSLSLFRMWSSLSVSCDRSVVFSTNKTDCHNITEILLKVALNIITLNLTFNNKYRPSNMESDIIIISFCNFINSLNNSSWSQSWKTQNNRYITLSKSQENITILIQKLKRGCRLSHHLVSNKVSSWEFLTCSSI
jgi:hypothetical protein